MLRFEYQEGFVQVDLLRKETDAVPSKGDVLLAVQISSAGFCGHNEVWILAAAFDAFCNQLTALERDRRGDAVLESISSDEFRVVIRSADSSGHMLIEGHTGYHVQTINCRSLWHSIQFGFEFDPSQLAKAAGLDWTRC